MDTFNPARGDALVSQPVLKSGLYQSAEESARRKQALIARLNERQRVAKAALVARRLLTRQVAAAPT